VTAVQQNLYGLSGDDLLYDISLTYGGAALDLADVAGVSAILKPNATSADSDGMTYTTGSGLTVVSAPDGTLTWLIPAADYPGLQWWRIIVLDDSNNVSTAVYGRLLITDV
jgi:hypothetical protein